MYVGVKDDLVNRIKEEDRTLETIVRKRLPPEHEQLIDGLVSGHSYRYLQEGEETLVHIGNYIEIKKNWMHCFQANMHLSSCIMTALICLLRYRNELVATSYYEENHNKQGFSPIELCAYFSPAESASFWLSNGERMSEEDFHRYFISREDAVLVERLPYIKQQQYKRFSFVINILRDESSQQHLESNSACWWIVVLVNIEEKTIFLLNTIDAQYPYTGLDESMRARMTNNLIKIRSLADRLASYFSQIGSQTEAEAQTPFKVSVGLESFGAGFSKPLDGMRNLHNSGILAFLVLYYDVWKTPVSFHENSMPGLRKTIAYWLSQDGKLPI